MTAGFHRLHSIPVKRGLFALAVNLERALVADRIGALENPVLPSGEAAEDPRGQSLGAVEAQVRLQRSQGVRTHGRAFLDRDADFLRPVDVVRNARGEAKGEGGVRGERLADVWFQRLERRPLVVETPSEAALAARHRVVAEVRRTHSDSGRFVTWCSEMVDPVAGKRDLKQGAGEARALVDERKQAARGDIEPAQSAAQIADGFARQPM